MNGKASVFLEARGFIQLSNNDATPIYVIRHNKCPYLLFNKENPPGT